MPPLTGHVHVASSAIPEQLYFLPLLWPEGDQLSATKGKIKKKKSQLFPCCVGAQEQLRVALAPTFWERTYWEVMNIPQNLKSHPEAVRERTVLITSSFTFII